MLDLGRCGRYELLRRIAVGGMAEIFLAHESGLAGFERLVIVKRVLPNLAVDTDFIDMFLDEARLAARLTHPNIVHIYELSEEGGTYFIAMEYVPGGDLHEMLRIRGDKLVPLAESLYIVGEICGGLQFAHALAGPDGAPLGVVHRDVTPKNVLMSVDGVVKLVDFGIAKARVKLSVTRPGDIKGTFSYMAPEQARGEEVDRRADVYAVGALLYRLVTGQRAYPQIGDSLLSAVRSGTFVRPRKLNRDLPRIIEDVILRAMAVDARDRYPTCGAMRRDAADAARSLSLHADSESVAALVREAFPIVPGVTGPVSGQAQPYGESEAASGPRPGSGSSPRSGPRSGRISSPASSSRSGPRSGPHTSPEPVSDPLRPAGPDEATGLVGLPPDDAAPPIPYEVYSPLGPGVYAEPGVSPIDPTELVQYGQNGYGGLSVQGAQAAVAAAPQFEQLSVPPADPFSGLPDLPEGEIDDQPTHIVDSAWVRPGAEGVDQAAVPPAPGGPAEPTPPWMQGGSSGADAEPLLVVGPRTPTSTPIVRGRKATPKGRSRAIVVLGLGLAVALALGAVVVGLVLLPRWGPASNFGTGTAPEGSVQVTGPGVPQVPNNPGPGVPQPGRTPTSFDAGAGAPGSLAPFLPPLDAGLGPTASWQPSGLSTSNPTKALTPIDSSPSEASSTTRSTGWNPPSHTKESVAPPTGAGVRDRPPGDGAGRHKTGGDPVEKTKRTPVGNAASGTDRTSKRTGYLTVWTTPYSKVYLGGTYLGTTPMAKREVPAGRHTVRLVNPDLPEKVVTVTVEPGEVARIRQQL